MPVTRGLSATDILGYALLILVLAPVAGAGLAAAFRSPVRRRGHQAALDRFRQGQGRDPERASIGPHRAFMHNFKLITAGLLGFGFVFLALTALAG